MFVPGIISLAFYKRRPSRVQVILGLVATIVLSALLGYISPSGSLGQVGSVILAVVGGVILYVVILAVLLYWYQQRHAKSRTQTPPTPAPGVGNSEGIFSFDAICIVAPQAIPRARPHDPYSTAGTLDKQQSRVLRQNLAWA